MQTATNTACTLALLAAALLFALPLQAQSMDSLAVSPDRAAPSAERDTTEDSPRRFDRLDPQRSHLFFTATARPVGGGAVYASTMQLVFVQVGVGLGEVFSLQGGVLVLPDDDFGALFSLTPKVTLFQGEADLLLGRAPLSVALDAWTLAEHQTYVYTTGDAEGDPFAYRTESEWDLATLPRVLATYGSSEAALTAGVGVPLGDGGASGVAAATLGGEVQLLEWFKLLVDNQIYFGVERADDFFYLVREAPGIRLGRQTDTVTRIDFMGGARFMGDHFALEAAAVANAFIPGPDDAWSVSPFLRLSYRF